MERFGWATKNVVDFAAPIGSLASTTHRFGKWFIHKVSTLIKFWERELKLKGKSKMALRAEIETVLVLQYPVVRIQMHSYLDFCFCMCKHCFILTLVA